jgi:hypothetical protein
MIEEKIRRKDYTMKIINDTILNINNEIRRPQTGS